MEKMLDGTQRRIWDRLRNLPDTEKITGSKLMEASGISSERAFHSTIESMRDLGYQIGASRGPTPGYYEKRTDQQAWDYYFKRLMELEREITKLGLQTQDFFEEKYGGKFDFLKEKSKQEVSRFEPK